LVVGPKAARALDRNAKVRIGANPRRNLELIAEAYGKNPSELRVALLDRERNANILHAVKGLGATAILLDGGDILPAIETALPESDIDVVYGSGGSPEAILTAAAIAGYGGNMQAMWHPKDDIELQRVHKLGQLNEILYIDDMVGRGEVYFCLTAVTKYKNLLQASSPNGPGDSMSSYSQSR
jgi:fructose-1,6-bisphosphatase II